MFEVVLGIQGDGRSRSYNGESDYQVMVLPVCGNNFGSRCKLGLEGIVSKRKDSAYRSGRSPDWLKMKNADAPAVKREAEEDWGR
jgi:hypothetical protein